MNASDLTPLGRVVQKVELRREKHSLSLRELQLPLADIDYKKLKIKPLTTVQRGVIALHLAGMSYVGISRATGIRPHVVHYVMNHPDAQEVLAKGYEQIDREVKSLYGPAVETIREALSDEDMRVALKASEIALKAVGKSDPALGNKEMTAEDVVQRMLEIRSEGPVHIRIGEEKRSIGNGEE